MDPFIKLHVPGTPSPMRFNVGLIYGYAPLDLGARFLKEREGCESRVIFGQDTVFVRETVDQIDALIAEACGAMQGHRRIPRYITLNLEHEERPYRCNIDQIKAYGLIEGRHDGLFATRVIIEEYFTVCAQETPEQIDQLIAEACAEEGR